MIKVAAMIIGLLCLAISAHGQTNTSTGDVTLNSTAWQVAMTNETENVPLIMTLYNYGPGGVVYGWSGTNAPHYLAPGTPSAPTSINIGPVAPAMAVMWWRCASNKVSSLVRMVRALQD